MQNTIVRRFFGRAAAGALLLATLVTTGCSKGDTSSSNVASSTDAANTSAPSTALQGNSASTADSRAHSAAAVTGDPAHGATVFGNNCAACHGAAGAGGGIGPVLKGEQTRKDFRATVAWIKNPAPPMPKLYPSPLSAQDVNDVAAYVESL